MIYIVEDDDNIRQMEAYALRGSGFELEKLTPGELRIRGGLLIAELDS